MASSLSNPGQWLIDLVNGNDDGTQTAVSLSTAITVPAIRYALSKVTGAISQLPLIAYERMPNGGAEKAIKHPWYTACKTRPNRFQGPFDFKEFLLTEAIMYGDGRAAIDNASKELLPIFNQATVTVWDDGEKYHCVKLDDNDPAWRFSTTRGHKQNVVVFDDMEIMHIKGLSTDGLTGTGIMNCKRTIRIAIDSENTVGTQLKKGFAGTVMLEVPAGMLRTQKEADEFLKGFQERHSGSDAAGKPGMLREGIKANVLSMTNVDQQMIEQRKFNRQDIAMLFGLESILGDNDSVSYNSLEQKNQAYLVGCLMRWIKKIEEECDYKLNTIADRTNDRYYFRFNIAALLRPDSKTQADILNSQIMTKVITRNEARGKLDLNPVPGGDVFENPAITPTEKEERPEPKQKPNNNNAIVENILRSLVRREARDAVSGTNRPNFLSWVDSYYAGWEPKLADKLEELDIDRDFARLHCEESKALLLNACECQPDKLKESIGTCVATWENRIYSIITGDINTQAIKRIEDAMHSIANKPTPNITINNDMPPPVVTVTNTTPEVVVNQAPINITNELPPANVTITNEMQPPSVTITNEVEPAAVDVNVNLPPRRTTTTVTRDKNGNVTGSEAIEDDANWNQ